MRTTHIPNMLSVIGIAFGVTAIVLFMFPSTVAFGVLCVLISAIIDRYDGRIARRTGGVTALGKKLDALNDFIAFGLAPITLYLVSMLHPGWLIATGVSTVYVGATAWRLRRFLIGQSSTTAYGLPSTLAGVILVVILYISLRVEHPNTAAWFSGLSMVLLAGLMVSRIPIPKK